MDFSSIKDVHPFFKFLQQNYDPTSRFKNQYKAQNIYNSNQMFQVPTTQMQTLSTKKFYRYFLTQNTPLQIVDGCAQWPAIQKWNADYLTQIFGSYRVDTK